MKLGAKVVSLWVKLRPEAVASHRGKGLCHYCSLIQLPSDGLEKQERMVHVLGLIYPLERPGVRSWHWGRQGSLSKSFLEDQVENQVLEKLGECCSLGVDTPMYSWLEVKAARCSPGLPPAVWRWAAELTLQASSPHHQVPAAGPKTFNQCEDSFLSGRYCGLHICGFSF